MPKPRQYTQAALERSSVQVGAFHLVPYGNLPENIPAREREVMTFKHRVPLTPEQTGKIKGLRVKCEVFSDQEGNLHVFTANGAGGCALMNVKPAFADRVVRLVAAPAPAFPIPPHIEARDLVSRIEAVVAPGGSWRDKLSEFDKTFLLNSCREFLKKVALSAGETNDAASVARSEPILTTQPHAEQTLRMLYPEEEQAIGDALFELSENAGPSRIVMTGEELDGLAAAWLQYRTQSERVGQSRAAGPTLEEIWYDAQSQIYGEGDGRVVMLNEVYASHFVQWFEQRAPSEPFGDIRNFDLRSAVNVFEQWLKLPLSDEQKTPVKTLTVYVGSLTEVERISFEDAQGETRFPVLQENREWADALRETVARKNLPYPSSGGASFTLRDPRDVASAALRNLDTSTGVTGCRDSQEIKERAIRAIRSNMEIKPSSGDVEIAPLDRQVGLEAIGIIERGEVAAPQFEGFVTRVDLACDAADVLDGARPLSEQPKILAALAKEYGQWITAETSGEKALLIVKLFCPLSQGGDRREDATAEVEAGKFLLSRGVRAYRVGQYTTSDHSLGLDKKWTVHDERSGFTPIGQGTSRGAAIADAASRIQYAVTVLDPAIIAGVTSERTLPAAVDAHDAVAAYSVSSSPQAAGEEKTAISF